MPNSRCIKVVGHSPKSSRCTNLPLPTFIHTISTTNPPLLPSPTFHQSATQVGAGAVRQALYRVLGPLLVCLVHSSEAKVQVDLSVIGDQREAVTLLHCVYVHVWEWELVSAQILSVVSVRVSGRPQKGQSCRPSC